MFRLCVRCECLPGQFGRHVVQLIATYPDRNEPFFEYPDLEAEDLEQALLYAAAAIDDRVIDLRRTHETAA